MRQIKAILCFYFSYNAIIQIIKTKGRQIIMFKGSWYDSITPEIKIMVLASYKMEKIPIW